jgi:hypothetical protein
MRAPATPCCRRLFCTAAEDNNEEKARLAKESAERETLEAEERRMLDAEERRLEAEAAAKSKSEAEARMAKEAEQRKKRAAERVAGDAAPATGPAAVTPSVALKSSSASPGSANGGSKPSTPAGGASGSTPTTPSAFSPGGEYDDDDDEPLPGDRASSQIPRDDVLEALHEEAKKNAKAKADAWRTARDGARKDAEAKAALRATEDLRLAKAASELKKQQEEANKAKAAADAKAKADAIAAMLSKLNEPELALPEAAEGAFSYAQLKELSGKEAMSNAGVLSTKREWYLSAAEFATVMGVPKAEFYTLPAWKQAKMKKDKLLF